jgi:hypothetical protein
MSTEEQPNRKYLWWFLIGVVILILPWLVLAMDT